MPDSEHEEWLRAREAQRDAKERRATHQQTPAAGTPPEGDDTRPAPVSDDGDEDDDDDEADDTDEEPQRE